MSTATNPTTEAELLAGMSPNARAICEKIGAFLDSLPPEREDIALTGLELLVAAHDDRPIPGHVKGAMLGSAYERARLAAPAVKEEPEDDEDGRVVFTDTSRAIHVERVESGRDRVWLDFTIGDDDGDTRALVGVDILGGRPGVELLILGNQIGPSFVDQPQLTIDDVRQIRDDLTALLADDRLLGALAEQQV